MHAFEFLDGVPQVLVPDNLKAAVTKPSFYDPDINPSYQDLADYYGAVVIPARVRKPRDKSKVENAVLQVERWVLAPLRHQRFFHLHEANKAHGSGNSTLGSNPFLRQSRESSEPGHRLTHPLRTQVHTAPSAADGHAVPTTEAKDGHGS
ncbi:MAG: transposase-like protein [Myxococcaceae bacterium]|nr:transposase-like protein [Myxococcaceae bacterium]